MKTLFAPAVCAAAILLSSVSVDAILAPAVAQDDVSFDSFHDYLANYGDWVYSDRWGEVWIPANVPDDFQPYGTNGYWGATDDYGWVWVSNYEWGDVPFHYGRWVNDPDSGWLWIPGYVWSPAWVVWRHNGDYTGWMPMPPDREFLGQGGPSIGFGLNIGSGINIGINFNDTSDYYGYSQWYPGYNQDRFARNWVFVNTGHLADRDFHRYWAPRGNNVGIIRNTTNITNYRVVNNYIVNRGVDVSAVQRASGRPVERVQLRQVMKRPQFVAQANAGVQIQQHMRQINPRGDGRPNSAPAPSQRVVQGLSNNVPQHAGHAPMHVFTKTTVTEAPAFKGKIAPGAEPGVGPGAKGGEPAHDMFKRPEGSGATSTPPAMRGPTNGPNVSTAPGGAMTGPQEEHRRTHETSPAGGAATTPSGPAVNAPEEHRLTPPPGETPPTTTMHRHEAPASGGAMTTPSTTGPTINAPGEHRVTAPLGETPPTTMHRHVVPGGELTGPTVNGPTVNAPANHYAEPLKGETPPTPPTTMRRETPPSVTAPAVTAPVERHVAPPTAAPAVAPHAHPVEKAPPPPPKPEEKNKKDKPPG